MSFDILNRNLNVFEPHFLEASAGTGKTFAIEHLVARLILEGTAPLTIDQILVVTFTKAATRELKLRIRRNLEKIKGELCTLTPTVDYVLAICEKQELLKEALDRIDAALICYDSAQIYTLHGFCYKILQEFAFEANVAMQMSDPEEKEHLGLLEELIKDHLKSDLSSEDFSPFQIQSLLRDHQNDPDKMVSKLVNLVANGKEIRKALTYSQAKEAFLQEVHNLRAIDAQFFESDLALHIEQYKGMPGDVLSQIALLTEIIGEKQCSDAQFDQLLSKDFFLDKMHEGNLKKRIKNPSPLKYPELYKLLPPIQTAKNAAHTFLRLTADLQKKSAALLDKHEKFSPDNLLLKVQEALKFPAFIQKVRAKFRAAVVDEFQDTDPIQWDILEKLFISHLDTICLVGDPKQSIYAFRNADVYIYMQAAHKMGPKSKKYLDTNFRSTSSLVEALNLLFSKAQKGWMDLPSSGETLNVMPVKVGSKVSCDEIAPIKFLIATGKKGRSRKFPTGEMLEKKVFPYIASEIISLHKDQKVPYHEMAILVKDRFQAKNIIEYLNMCGLSAKSKRSASITESKAYFALKEILSAVLAPHDMSKLKIALGSHTDLLAAKAQMQKLNRTLNEKGFGPFFEQLLKTSLLEPNQDLKKLAEILVEEESINGTCPLRYLEEMQNNSDDDSRFKVFAGDDQESIQVMTVHMSKGLEFDTVFALGTASRHKPSEQIIIKEQNRSILTLFDPTNPDCLRAIEESDAEKMRQLYVAFTRAKTRLYIPVMLDEENKEIALGEASATELFLSKISEKNPLGYLGSLSPLIRAINLEETNAPSLEPTICSEIIADPPPTLTLPSWDQKELSFTALAKKGAASQSIKLSEDAPLSPHTMPFGAETGIVLHTLFEQIFKMGLHTLSDLNSLDKLIQEQIIFSCLGPWLPILLPWVIDLLKQPIHGFSLSDIPHSQLQQEMEFYYPIQAGAMKGFADLFFQIDGKYYILDWKSNCLGMSDADYSPEKIAEAMKQNDYGLQASIYAEALKRYVKLFDTRNFSECFGGAIYYFVRGKAALHFFPGDTHETI